MKRPDTTNGTAAARGLSPAEWATLLGRHDPVWEEIPAKWEHGAFIGIEWDGSEGEADARIVWCAHSAIDPTQFRQEAQSRHPSGRSVSRSETHAWVQPFAEGAFLVSAVRRAGETQWIQVTSLAGEPCRLRLGMRGPIWTDGPENTELRFPDKDITEVNLDKGQTILFFRGNERPDLVLAPLPAEPDQINAYGLKHDYEAPFFYRPA